MKNLRFNYIMNILDGGFFGFAIGFASFSTIIPLFVSNLTDSAVLIGLIPAIHNMGWQLPQLLTAKWISRQKVLKPFILLMSINERMPFLALALVAFLLPSIGKTLGLIITFAILIWQGIGAGVTANGWQNFIGKIIPGEYRGTFFGAQSSAANLLASFGAIIAGLLLDKLVFPNNFALCFLIASGLMVVSWTFLSRSREVPRSDDEIIVSEEPLIQNVVRVLKTDRPFRWFLFGRILFQFAMMSFAFYIVYCVKHLSMSSAMAGIMTSVLFITSVVANTLLGWIADKWSKRGVLELGAIAGVLSSILAFLAVDLNLFYLVFILNGISGVAFWTVGIAYTLDFGTEAERPTYVGMANTLIAPSAILAPLLGGWLADAYGYGTTFIVAAIAGMITVVVIHISGKK